jgi:hypothetical protein
MRYQQTVFNELSNKDFMPPALEMLWAILRNENWDKGRHRLEPV